MNPFIATTIKDYFRTKPVEKAWVFGSVSRGEERKDSDVDIMVSMSPDSKMGLAWFGMIVDLEKRLKRPVDMVVEGDLLPFAKESAERDKILVYERGM